MNQIFDSINALKVTTQEADSSALNFVEDIEYEFVGGGNAVNAY